MIPRSFIWAGVPENIFLSGVIIQKRSQCCMARERSCVENRMPLFSSTASFLSSSTVACLLAISKKAVGSSRRINGVSVTSARAMATRWNSPSDRSALFLPARCEILCFFKNSLNNPFAFGVFQTKPVRIPVPSCAYSIFN